MAETKFTGMEFQLPRSGTVAVERIANDRNTQPSFMSCVYSKLMSAPGHGNHGNAGFPRPRRQSAPSA